MSALDSVALSSIDRDCASLGGLFQSIVHELKGSPPVWEDFISKATKLHHQLKATILATGAFLDCFQKVADMATSSKGSTRDIGSALTRLCMRHRNLEAKLKQFSSSIVDCLIGPLQEKIPDWRTTSLQLDKDHAKEYKRLRADIKRVNAETMRLEKKYKKSAGRGDVARRLELSKQELSDKYLILEESEKAAVRQAMIEERSRFCLFVSYLKPVMDEEVSMIAEVNHLQEIVESLISNSNDPFTLPKSSEQIIHDMKGQDSTVWAPFNSTPPSSPSSIGSRKSSVCSISSFNSISSGSTTGTGTGLPAIHMGNGYPSSPQSHVTPTGTLAPSNNPITSASAPVTRRSNSQDSGFTSQDTLFLKPQGLTPPVNWKQSSASRVTPDEVSSEAPKLATTSPSPSSPSSSSNSSSTPSSPYPSGGEAGPRPSHPLEGFAQPAAPPSLAISTVHATRPASDDGYNSGGGASQNQPHNSSFGSSSTQSTTPPPPVPTLTNNSVIQRRGSNVSMPSGDFDAGLTSSHCGSSSPQKPPIPDKPPPIARKPSLKPTLKTQQNPPLNVPDFSQGAVNQMVQQQVSHQEDNFGDPYATLKPNRGGSKRSLAKDMDEGCGMDMKPVSQPEVASLTRNDSEISLTEALNRSLLMATQAMEELSAMSAAESQDQTKNQRPPSGLSQVSGFDGDKGSSRSPTPSSGTLRRNSSLSANRPPPPVRRSSSLSTNAHAEQTPNHVTRNMAPLQRSVTVTRSQSVASSDVSHAPPTAVSCASNRVGGGGGGGGGGDEGSVARGRTALMESLNAKLGGASPQAKVVSMQPKNLGQRDPSPSMRPQARPPAPAPNMTPFKHPAQPFALQPHPYAPSPNSNSRPAPPPPPPPPVAQNLANSGLAAAGGGGTGLLGTDELRSSLLSEIKAVGGSGFRGLRPVRPEGVNDRSAPRIN